MFFQTKPVPQTWKEDRSHMLRNFRVGNPQSFIFQEAPAHVGILTARNNWALTQKIWQFY
jgi:hypothetical protein